MVLLSARLERWVLEPRRYPIKFITRAEYIPTGFEERQTSELVQFVLSELLERFKQREGSRGRSGDGVCEFIMGVSG